MDRFPQSALLHRRQILFADVGPGGKMENINPSGDEEAGKKIWQFKSVQDYELNLLNDSLDISSRHHKTYNLNGGDKFRDIIEFTLNNFFETINVPIINRIGLRYIDECPIPSKDNDTFKEFYNSVFPVDRFNLEDVKEMDFKTVITKQQYSLRYIESLKQYGENYKLILDFDGFAENIKTEDYLSVTDDLHELILSEFEQSIKGPVYNYMRGGEN